MSAIRWRYNIWNIQRSGLRRGEEGSVLKGQRLIYDNELDWADDICTDGCVVDVLDSRQRFAAARVFQSELPAGPSAF